MGATRPAGKMQCSYTISKGSQTARITLMSVSLCHKNPDARRVAPISACVWCLRLVVAFFADFVNASPNQLTQLTDFQYALCDGEKKVTKSGNEHTLCMSNLYQNPVTNHNTRIYVTNNYTFIAIMRYHIIRIIRIIPPKPRIYTKHATNYACSRHLSVPSHLPHAQCEYDLKHHHKGIFSQQADNNLTQPIFSNPPPKS